MSNGVVSDKYDLQRLIEHQRNKRELDDWLASRKRRADAEIRTYEHFENLKRCYKDLKGSNRDLRMVYKFPRFVGGIKEKIECPCYSCKFDRKHHG